jgi:uncharacterized protein with HEPN domain
VSENKDRRDWLRLKDILSAINDARNDLGEMSLEQFQGDSKTQRAVIQSLTVIGEASHLLQKYRPELELSHADLWEQLSDAYAMRNFLTHQYFQIQSDIVYKTVKDDLPVLELGVKSLN